MELVNANRQSVRSTPLGLKGEIKSCNWTGFYRDSLRSLGWEEAECCLNIEDKVPPTKENSGVYFTESDGADLELEIMNFEEEEIVKLKMLLSRFSHTNSRAALPEEGTSDEWCVQHLSPGQCRILVGTQDQLKLKDKMLISLNNLQRMVLATLWPVVKPF